MAFLTGSADQVWRLVYRGHKVKLFKARSKAGQMKSKMKPSETSMAKRCRKEIRDSGFDVDDELAEDWLDSSGDEDEGQAKKVMDEVERFKSHTHRDTRSLESIIQKDYRSNSGLGESKVFEMLRSQKFLNS